MLPEQDEAKEETMQEIGGDSSSYAPRPGSVSLQPPEISIPQLPISALATDDKRQHPRSALKDNIAVSSSVVHVTVRKQLQILLLLRAFEWT